MAPLASPALVCYVIVCFVLSNVFFLFLSFCFSCSSFDCPAQRASRDQTASKIYVGRKSAAIVVLSEASTSGCALIADAPERAARVRQEELRRAVLNTHVTDTNVVATEEAREIGLWVPFSLVAAVWVMVLSWSLAGAVKRGKGVPDPRNLSSRRRAI